ncbi:restriction endonuclease subunit S [Stutzerimonas stutzeri]|jgi:type I restriction enzyme, S subunit|uniref:restriction endonuclease subunit S n=1 Tax=Stutzerimonas stutzeri TaxID=316 RepID=UPI001C4C5A96|nr:restriction endonuclease subunit S [Stutzerimonas stutzeri]MDH0059665.1 restriction endonuclease subunit S [Stutzerimonas stutzeri]QXP24723.1 restriction endonuclease subunit S [Stutzerimonas stutzeri]
MSELMLANWADCKLGDIASIIRGVTFPASSKVYEPADGYVACLRTSHVQEKLLWESIYYIPENYVKRADQLVGKNDILMSMANSSNLVGKVCINETDRTACFGAFLSAIRSKEIDHRYVYYYLKSSEAQRALKASASQTVNIANISVGALENLRVPLPPLAEQTRIAAKLDELLAQVDTLKARIDGIPALLKRFRQSVLAAAVSGGLTEEWRAENSNPGWSEIKLEDLLAGAKHGICRGPFGSSIKKEYFVPEGYKVYEQKNAIRDNSLIGEYFVDEKKYKELERFSVRSGDFIVSCAGTLGRISLLPSNAPAGLINQALIRIRTNKKLVLDEYFLLLFKSPSFQEKLVVGARGGAMQNLASTKEIKALEINCPTIVEQAEIVRRVEQLFAFADQLEARIKTGQARIDHLTRSILAKAFRGELVPQDPNDESASLLLERIKAQRTATPKAKRGRRSA